MGHPTLLAGLALTAGLVAATAAPAATLRITITNTADVGGFSLTPVYTAFHNGTFDAFDAGALATPGVELLAELGDASGLPAERLAQDPGSTARMIAQPANGPGTIDPGESGFVEVDLDTVNQRFFTFLSMIVPSNDTFIGNDDPEAIELFDAAGNYLGDQTIELTGLDIYDAGTEANLLENGAAFVTSVDGAAPAVPAPGGVATRDNIVLASLLGFRVGSDIGTPAGPLDAALTQFSDDPAAFSVARIEIAAVPLPAAAPMLGGALLLLGAMRVRKRARA
ncbi:MAG: spondin domain-containing protein [Pseudomonadota bacterium]